MLRACSAFRHLLETSSQPADRRVYYWRLEVAVGVPGRFMSTRIALLSCLLFASAAPAPAQHPAAATAIQHVTVIDGTGAPQARNVTVVIRGGRIESIRPSGGTRIPAGVTIIEGRGKYLIPGLIDTHTHIASEAGTPKIERALAFALSYGVTGLRDASGSGHERELVDLRARIDHGEVLAPRLYVSGTAAPQNVTRHHAPDLAGLIRQLRDIGVDGIKLRNLTAEDGSTAIHAAKAAGLPIFGHTYRLKRGEDFTQQAVRAGISGIMHVAGIGPARSLQPRAVTATGWQREWLALYLQWLDASAAEESQLLEALLTGGVWLEPTLTTETFVIYDEWYRKRQENRLLAQLWKQSYVESREGFPAFTGSDLQLARQGFIRMQTFVRRFQEAGGLVLAGTDNLPWPAAGVHEELRLLVDAGLSPLAALQAATRNAARALGWERRTGTIEVGRDADLVLLDASPLTAVTNTMRIHAVVRAGRLFDRAALDRLRDTAGNVGQR